MKSFSKTIIVWFLTLEAKLVLRKYRPRVIAITGSVGKTSTKDAVAAALATRFRVRKSEKSFNSELGVPLTILGLPNGWDNPFFWLWILARGFVLILARKKYPEWMVLEIGADRPGDIEKICEWLVSDIVIITRLAKIPAHVEFFATPEDVLLEKSKLIKTIRDGGTLILNADDDDVAALGKLFRGKTLTFGLNNSADLRASNYQLSFEKKEGEGKTPDGITFKIKSGGNLLPVAIKGALGRQLIYPSLAALAVGIFLNQNLIEIIEKLAEHKTPNGRMKIIPGLKGSLILDDTYNSSPVALAEALSTLESIETSERKIAVLGDMLELGRYSAEEHRRAGLTAGKICDLLLVVGPRSRGIAEGALENGMADEKVLEFDSAKTAGEYLQNEIIAGDIVLVKGSQGMRLEKTVEEIMAEPEKASELLVRQEKEWKKKG